MKQPQIGIWWLVGRTLVSFNQDAEKVQAVNGVQDSDLAHIDVWQKVVVRFRKLHNSGYESIPRGRVLKHRENFHIFGPGSVTKDMQLIEKIVTRFRLPSDRCKLFADVHYNPPSECEWED